MIEQTGSVQIECNKRLETLYKKHHNWLGAVAYNITKSHDVSEELVSDLYLYLSEKCNHKLWFSDSFNLQYCRSFILSRFINRVKKDNKTLNKDNFVEDGWDMQDEEYDYEKDIRIEEAYNDVKDELERMKKRRGWSSAMLYEHYWFSNKTLDEVSKDIGVSKSTVFLAVKKVKGKLKDNINNPFKTD